MSPSKVLVGIIALFLLLGVWATPIIQGVDNWRTSDQLDGFAGVTTAAGITTANVTLTEDLYQANLAKVTTITSTNGTDTPVLISYIEATKVLQIGGLDDDNTRDMSVAYKAETDDTVMRAMGPFMAFLIIGGCVGAIFWGILKH